MTNQTMTSSQDSKSTNWMAFLTIFLKTTLLSFVFVFIFLLITASVIAAIGLKKISDFESITGANREALFSSFKKGISQQPKQTDNKVTFLILGTDELANRGNAEVLTDTMLLATVSLEKGTIHLLSIPRDLWSEEYKTKINSLYSYGKERYPDSPQQFPTEVISTLTNIPIHHTIVISLETLANLIDSVGGISVDVPVGFTDTQFPRSDVDVTVERDPAKLYKTVTFDVGNQLMSGERALEYIRSRHSQDIQQGSDTARSQRQQLIIQALMKKTLSKETLGSTENVANLYTLYMASFNQYISIVELIALSKTLYPYRTTLAFQQESLSIYPEDPNGVIYHPPERNYQNQWVYAIRDQENFKNEIQNKLLTD